MSPGSGGLSPMIHSIGKNGWKHAALPQPSNLTFTPFYRPEIASRKSNGRSILTRICDTVLVSAIGGVLSWRSQAGLRQCKMKNSRKRTPAIPARIPPHQNCRIPNAIQQDSSVPFRLLKVIDDVCHRRKPVNSTDLFFSSFKPQQIANRGSGFD